MRISVEQYRSRFGFHNHFITMNAKDALLRFKNQSMSYCGTFATILGAKTLIFMPKLKQVVTQYKMWNEVMLG